MAASSVALKAAYTTEIATISDTLQSAKATYTLDRYIEALDKQNALEANEIQSYTMAGRTFTRRDASAGQDVINELQYELEGYIYGHVVLADNNTGVPQPA